MYIQLINWYSPASIVLQSPEMLYKRVLEESNDDDDGTRRCHGVCNAIYHGAERTLLSGRIFYSSLSAQKNLDPEVLQDFEKRQARINGIRSSLTSGDFKSG